jgi:Neuraminidase (sialidase)
MNVAHKNLRKQVYDVVLYTKGAFSVKELYNMPVYHTTEIIDAFSEKNRKEQDAIDAASGKKTF